MLELEEEEELLAQLQGGRIDEGKKGETTRVLRYFVD